MGMRTPFVISETNIFNFKCHERQSGVTARNEENVQAAPAGEGISKRCAYEPMIR